MTREYEDNKRNQDDFLSSPSGRLLLAVIKTVVIIGCFLSLLIAIFGRFM